MSHADEGVETVGAVPEAVEPRPTTKEVEPQSTNMAVSLMGGFSDAELYGLTQRELQVASRAIGSRTSNLLGRWRPWALIR